MIEAVLFDFDGVLADTTRWHIEAWKNVLGELKFVVEPEIVYLNEGRPAFEIAQRLAENVGSQFGESDAKKLALRKNALFREIHNSQTAQGAENLLRELKKRGKKTALVTGTVMENVTNVLSEESLQLIDVIITEKDTARGKPAPDPYLGAAKKLDIDPAKCVAIENAPLGIQSALAAGMQCVALATTLHPRHLSAANLIYANLMELSDRLEYVLNL